MRQRTESRCVEEMARRAWFNHVACLPGVPLRWAELAAEIAGSVPEKQREQTLAMVLLVLDNASDLEDLVHGGWVSLANIHRYTHFDTRGWGDARTLRVCERIIEHLDGALLLGAWERELLLDEVDRARESVGVKPVRATRVVDRWLLPAEVPELARAFAREAKHPLGDSLVERAVSYVVAFVARPQYDPGVQLGRLDPDALALAQGPHGEETSEQTAARLEANRCLYFSLSAFYGWLGEREHLTKRRAEELRARLARHAMTSLRATARA